MAIHKHSNKARRTTSTEAGKQQAKQHFPAHIEKIYQRMCKRVELSTEDFSALAAFAAEHIKGEKRETLAWDLFSAGGRAFCFGCW